MTCLGCKVFPSELTLGKLRMLNSCWKIYNFVDSWPTFLNNSIFRQGRCNLILQSDIFFGRCEWLRIDYNVFNVLNRLVQKKISVLFIALLISYIRSFSRFCRLCPKRWTRWYPRGIQKLVSTYDLRGGYSGVRTENTQSAKICLGGYSGVRTENTQSVKICLNFNFFWGGGLSDLKFQRGALWRIWTQILLFVVTVHKPACASQIVSHILRMWRLTNTN